MEAMNIYSKTILFLQRYDCQSLRFEQGKISYILGLKKKKANQQKYMTYSKGSTIYSFLIEKINYERSKYFCNFPCESNDSE